MASHHSSSRLFFRWLILVAAAFSTFFLVLFAGIKLLSIDRVEARSIAESTAERIAEMAGNSMRDKVEQADKNRSISSLGNCTSGVIAGEMFSGSYEIRFLNVSNADLSCSRELSSVASLKITGYFDGAKAIIAIPIVSDARSEYRCTGNRPSFTTVYSGDDAGLTQNLAWQYAESNTDRKCEFACQSGSSWNGSTCSQPEGGEYVTTGSENQVKSGSFGVQGAFKAYNGISVNGKKIVNVAAPVEGTDLATKAYVDEAVRAAFGG